MRAGGSSADLMESVAFPVAITVISELLGVPAAERAAFRASSDTLMSLPAAAGSDLGEAWSRLSVLIDELVEGRRRSPGDDLLSALIAVRDADTGRLSPAELATMVVTLITAGYVTTAAAVGVGVVLLTEHQQWQRLHDEPAVVPAAVEEVLRFQAVAGDLVRVATEEVRIGDVTVHAGDRVIVSLAAANRDERRFPDPDRFDIARTDERHLSFGHGIHHCLGAALARVELQAVLGALADLCPDLRLDIAPDILDWQRSELFGDEWPRTVPVRWST